MTWTVRSDDAPSPSAACCRARSRATASIAPRSTSAAGVASRIGAPPSAPEASTNTVSLVEVSPSTVSWFQVRAMIGRMRRDNVSGSIVASVVMTESIVAIRGWIIPTPLAMPDTRTCTVRSAVGMGHRERRGRDLGHRVGRAQRLGRRQQRLVGRRERPRDGVDARLDAVDGQPGADDPGREAQHLQRVDPQPHRRGHRDRELIRHPVHAGRRIGRPGRGDDGLGIAVAAGIGVVGAAGSHALRQVERGVAAAPQRGGEVRPRHEHRRGRELVGGEHRGRRGRSAGRPEDREVRPAARLDARGRGP